MRTTFVLGLSGKSIHLADLYIGWNGIVGLGGNLIIYNKLCTLYVIGIDSSACIIARV